MPNTKSAAKQIRINIKNNARNKPVRSQIKTAITNAESLISAGKIAEAKGATLHAISTLDKAAEKRVIHPNNAARRKSRLARKLNQAQAASAPPAEPSK